MRAELRKSGGPQCQTCGSFDLIYANEEPLTADLAHLLEVEMLKREVRLARVFSDHLAEVERDYAESLVARDWEAHDERAALISDLEGILTGMTIEVNPWRAFKAHREKKFRERVEAALAELYDLTRFPFTVPESEVRELAAAEPDRS